MPSADELANVQPAFDPLPMVENTEEEQRILAEFSKDVEEGT